VAATFIILAVLSSTIGIGALLTLAWLSRALKWEVVDDDELHYRLSRDRFSGRAWLKRWLKPKPRLLTYKRDHLGRFRRYRR
jgi:hypothetical protein